MPRLIDALPVRPRSVRVCVSKLRNRTRGTRAPEESTQRVTSMHDQACSRISLQLCNLLVRYLEGTLEVFIIACQHGFSLPSSLPPREPTFAMINRPRE